MKEYWVYILQCADESYYTGVTNDIERRLAEHMRGSDKTSYTNGRRPFKLVYSYSSPYILNAISWEKQIKGWTRKKKQALIAGDGELLIELAKGTARRRIDGIVVMVRRTHHDNLWRKFVTLSSSKSDRKQG